LFVYIKLDIGQCNIYKLFYDNGMKKDVYILLFLFIMAVSIPFGIRAYDQSLKPEISSDQTREFILTGHAQKGWLLEEVEAWDMLSIVKHRTKREKPIIHVNLNDNVVLKLRSADVTHGFTLKGYEIFISKGIEPGNTIYAKFKADKEGTFLFACNVFCGDIHHSMHGHLVVEKR